MPDNDDKVPVTLRRRSPARVKAKKWDKDSGVSDISGVEDTGIDDTGVSDDAGASARLQEGGDKLLSGMKMRKMLTRALWGTFMMITFSGVIYLGHAYVCMLVFALQCFIFSELVGVRKILAAERRLPLFRSIQWAWFFVAAYFTWSANIFEFLLKSPKGMEIKFRIERIKDFSIGRLIMEHNMMTSFSLYSALLVLSVLSLRKGLYRYQISQYTWTILSICIVVFQTQACFHIIYAGLFWFVLPSSLVICNDIMAYYCGQVFGKRIVRRRFLQLSPNKTWEGFLGSALCTLVFAFWFSGKLASYEWLTCVPDDITFAWEALSCTPAPIYRTKSVATWARERPTSGILQAAILVGLSDLNVAVIQLHALCLGLFASFVAPFGGFLSSAIKRAYGIKDFNTIIPGHGGLMDRFDCQFVMFLCTFVHYRTFCHTPYTVNAILASASQLTVEEQSELLARLQTLLQPGPDVKS